MTVSRRKVYEQKVEAYKNDKKQTALRFKIIFASFTQRDLID